MERKAWDEATDLTVLSESQSAESYLMCLICALGFYLNILFIEPECVLASYFCGIRS